MRLCDGGPNRIPPEILHYFFTEMLRYTVRYKEAPMTKGRTISIRKDSECEVIHHAFIVHLHLHKKIRGAAVLRLFRHPAAGR